MIFFRNTQILFQMKMQEKKFDAKLKGSKYFFMFNFIVYYFMLIVFVSINFQCMYYILKLGTAIIHFYIH